MTNLHATVTAYKGHLVLELLAKQSIPNEVATSLDNPGNIGQVIMNSAERLGVSAEARELLAQVKPGHDSIGDVDWFQSGSLDVFGWIGGPYAIKKPSECEAARGFKLRASVDIPNEPAQGAKDAIDEMTS